MPSYILYYFNQRGRAEICRMLFAAAGVQYNDKRIETTEWNNMRSKMPCSMLPLLEIDNKTQIPQSMAIARYLAREFGFHGKTNIDMARVEYITDCFFDIIDDYMKMYNDKEGRMMFQRSQDASGTSEVSMRFQDTCRRILPFLEKTLEMVNGGNQYFMGEQLTMADMMCYSALENPLMENPALLTDYPKLQALRNRIHNHPKIAPYMKKRNLTDF